MKKIVTYCFVFFLLLNLKSQSDYTLCPGDMTTIFINHLHLTAQTFSINPPAPGGGGHWTVTPASTTTYSMYVTGTNSNNAVVTESATAKITIKAIPDIHSVQSAQNFTIGCGEKSVATITISPPAPSLTAPLFAVVPSTYIPFDISAFSSSLTHSITQAGSYRVYASFPGMPVCWDSVAFSVTENKIVPVFSLSATHANIPCVGDVKAATFTVTTSGSGLSVISGAGWMSGNTLFAFQPGTYSLSSFDPETGCTGDTTVNVGPEPIFHGVKASPTHYTLCESTGSVALTASITGNPAGVMLSWKKISVFPQVTVSTSSVYVATAIGVYAATATNSSGCTVTDNSYVDICVGITETKRPAFSIWPNPTQHTLYIQETGSPIGMVKVYDVAFREIKRFDAGSNPTLDVSLMMPGIYFIEAGGTVRRFIKE